MKKGIILLLVLFFVSACKNKTTNNEIKVGIITPLTGENATYGNATKLGVELALDKMDSTLNKKGLNIKLIYEDSKFSSSEGTKAINKLINFDKVSCILGPFGSSVVLSVAKIANDNTTVILSASATDDKIREAGDYVFRNVPPNSLQGKTMADYVINDLKITNNIVICKVNKDYGISLAKSFYDRINNLGGGIVLEESFAPNQKDYKTIITKIKNSNPLFIYIPAHYNEVGHFLKQAEQLGLNVLVGGGDGAYSNELFVIASNAAESFYLTLMGVDENNKQYKEFINLLQKRNISTPNIYSIYAYDAMLLYIKTFISLKEKDLRLNNENIKDELYKIDFYGATGETKFDKNGEVEKPFSIYKVENQKFIKLK